MPIATPEVYAAMLDRAKAGAFAYPAINCTSSQTIVAAIRGFAEAESDGIIQISVGGAEYASGSTIKDRVAGSLAMAAYAREIAKNYPVTVALHTDHCAKQNLDSWVRPLLELEAEEAPHGVARQAEEAIGPVQVEIARVEAFRVVLHPGLAGDVVDLAGGFGDHAFECDYGAAHQAEVLGAAGRKAAAPFHAGAGGRQEQGQRGQRRR